MDRQVVVASDIYRFSSPEKARGELSQSFVALVLRSFADVLDVRAKLFLSPVVTSRAFSTSRVAGASCLEQRLGRSLVVSGIISGREIIAFARITPRPCIFFYKRTRHRFALDV